MFDTRGAPRGPGRGRDGGRPGRGGYGPGRPRHDNPFAFPIGLSAMFGRARAVRRGDVRSAILALLAEAPMHGYQIIQELTERTAGAWRPSAGSVYPTLQQLTDEGLVEGVDRDGRRVFSLTEAGQRTAADVQRTGRPWDVDDRKAGVELRRLVMQVVKAAMQVEGVASAATREEARRILVQTRRDLYRLLADDDGGVDDAQAPAAPADDPSQA